MKPEIRLLGIDDAPFSFQDETTSIIGAIMRGGSYIESILHRRIQIDGVDATETCTDMILNTRFYKQLKAVLFDGVTLGGFNIIDRKRIYEETKIPIISITRDEPDFEKIKIALKHHFDDWKKRYDLMAQGKLVTFKTQYNPIYCKYVGLTNDRAKEIIKLATIHGVIPEPIRVAHLIASGITRGESYGKA